MPRTITSEKRKQTFTESHGPLQDGELTELKQIIQETVLRDDNNNFLKTIIVEENFLFKIQLLLLTQINNPNKPSFQFQKISNFQ